MSGLIISLACVPFFLPLTGSVTCDSPDCCDISSSYDALVDLFECIANFLRRLSVYTEIPPSPELTDIIVKIMVELLSVLALATKQIRQGRFSEYAFTHTSPYIKYYIEKIAKKPLGESEVESVLQRLDRLTEDEARMTVAQTLDVVHGLMNHMKVVMDSEQFLSLLIAKTLLIIYPTRWQGVDRQYSTSIGYVCPEFETSTAHDHPGS